MKKNKKTEPDRPCPCTQAAADLLRAATPAKSGMLKEVECKKCGKTFPTNFDTEYCFDCWNQPPKG